MAVRAGGQGTEAPRERKHLGEQSLLHGEPSRGAFMDSELPANIKPKLEPKLKLKPKTANSQRKILRGALIITQKGYIYTLLCGVSD